jgi:hypothetical protein
MRAHTQASRHTGSGEKRDSGEAHIDWSTLRSEKGYASKRTACAAFLWSNPTCSACIGRGSAGQRRAGRGGVGRGG